MSSSANFGRAAGDYARHRQGFPESFFDRLVDEGLSRPGLDVVDLGTGTGAMARGWARRGCRVTGVDPSPGMLEQARAIDARAGLEIVYREGQAEATGLPAAAFDVATAGQCWHWFDRALATTEVRRILRPGGALLIGHFDWLPRRGNLVADTEALILRHNPRWTLAGGSGIYPDWFSDLEVAGFDGIRSFSYETIAVYSPESWRGRIRASAGVGGSLGHEQVARFDDELSELLARRHPGDELAVPHRVFAVWGRAPG